MSLEELAQLIPDFALWEHSDKIKLFAWFLHVEGKQDRFQGADIGRCYGSLHLPKPSSFGPYLERLERKKEILRDAGGLYLSRSVRDIFAGKYIGRVITLQVANMLETLPDQIPDLGEKTFLVETLRCLKVGAFRASVVMGWNLTYHHLCHHVLKSPERLSVFNSRWPAVYQGHHKKGPKVIARMDDFGEHLKESEVIEILPPQRGLITKESPKNFDRKS